MGAGPDEVAADYMLTFYNYYGIEPGTEQYTYIAESNIKASLAKAFGIESIDDAGVDLVECASRYLKDIGMSDEELASLKENLGEDYDGQE